MTKNTEQFVEGIGTYVPESAPNKWADKVNELVAAHAENPNATLAIKVPAGQRKDGSSAEGGKDRVLFQQAAREAGFTARIVQSVPLEGDEQGLVFRLTKLNMRGPRDSASVEESPEGDNVEAPTE